MSGGNWRQSREGPMPEHQGLYLRRPGMPVAGHGLCQGLAMRLAAYASTRAAQDRLRPGGGYREP
jgi:hypothetical protein